MLKSVTTDTEMVHTLLCYFLALMSNNKLQKGEEQPV
jgi:hypothetical protein